MSQKPTPNDQRSEVKNPTSDAHAADIANRQKLGHSNVPTTTPQTVPQPVPPKK